MKLSGIYKRRGFRFRYDFTCNMVSIVEKASKEQFNDNKEWQAHYGKNLWDIDPYGYIELDAAGLTLEHWKDKQARDEYLDEWIDEMEEETRRDVQNMIREMELAEKNEATK